MGVKISALPTTTGIVPTTLLATVNPTGPVTQKATVDNTSAVTGGVGAPGAAVPPTSFAIWIDTTTGTVYYYYSGTWH